MPAFTNNSLPVIITTGKDQGLDNLDSKTCLETLNNAFNSMYSDKSITAQINMLEKVFRPIERETP